MRTLLKSFLIVLVALLLLVGLLVGTFAFWGPAAFQWSAAAALRQAGFSEVELSVESLSLRRLSLAMNRLQYPGATLLDAALDVDYDLEGLFSGELRAIRLMHPRLEIDLSDEWHRSEPGERGGAPLADTFPARFPVKYIHLQDGVVLLRGSDWSRSLEIGAELSGQERMDGTITINDEALYIDLRADILWSEWLGRVTATAEVRKMEELVEFARDRGWLTLPAGFSFNAQPVAVEFDGGLRKQSPLDWKLVLRNQGFAASLATSRFTAEQFELEAGGTGVEPGQFELKITGGTAAHEGMNFSFGQGTGSVYGTWPDSLGALVGVRAGRVTWSDGGGRLNGLEGSFEMASLVPLASKGFQTLRFTSIQQGEFVTGSGELRLDYASERKSPLELEIITSALGGQVRLRVSGAVSDTLALSVQVFLDSVELSELASLFPQFDGRIEGLASGKLALRLEGPRIVLQPGGIQLAAGTTGRFQYLRQGWLTQNPQLNPEVFVGRRNIVDIMQDPQGATALTELAMRDLYMDAFHLEIQETAAGAQSVVAQIKGNRTINGIKIPVVLDVPIRGDVKETINAVFEFNARM